MARSVPQLIRSHQQVTTRRSAIASLLAIGVRRLRATQSAATFSAGKSLPHLSESRPSELALPAQTSVTVHAG